MHAYKSDPQSGAGNCTCGQAQRTRAHPHKYTPMMNDPKTCVCGLGRWEKPHQFWDQPVPFQELHTFCGRCGRELSSMDSECQCRSVPPQGMDGGKMSY